MKLIGVKKREQKQDHISYDQNMKKLFKEDVVDVFEKRLLSENEEIEEEDKKDLLQAYNEIFNRVKEAEKQK